MSNTMSHTMQNVQLTHTHTFLGKMTGEMERNTGKVVEIFYLKLKSFRIGQVDRVRTKSKWIGQRGNFP